MKCTAPHGVASCKDLVYVPSWAKLGWAGFQPVHYQAWAECGFVHNLDSCLVRLNVKQSCM